MKSNNHIIEVSNLNVWYEKRQAISNVNVAIPGRKITAVIGPSGCGKSTFLRAFNRMNEIVANSMTDGEIFVEGQNIYDPQLDLSEIRQRIGMVFQKPNPFPRSIFENIAWKARTNNHAGNLDDLVQSTLEKTGLWNEVKDKLHQNALSLSGGQQQRLCIARAIAVQPQILLMDEPCSALDPIATFRIEELMQDLASEYTIIIVTHNIQQASRVSDHTAFFSLNEQRVGELIEFGQTTQLFMKPRDSRTEGYIQGRYG